MRWLNNMIWAFLIVALLIFTNTSAIMTVLTPDPLVYKNLPFETGKDTYRIGESINIHVVRCVNSKEPITITSTRHFLNLETQEVIAIGSDFRVIQPGCVDTWNTVSYIFPQDMPSGVYILEGQGLVQVKLPTTTLYDENIWQTKAFRFIGED